jgi:hypothetical protein
MTLMTSNFRWEKVSQVRLHVAVQSVIDLITKSPRPVPAIGIADWKLVRDGNVTAVQHVSGIHCAYREHKLPPSGGNFPVLIGVGNGKMFLIDGAHRMARALKDGSKTINAIVLTEAETRSCIRTGMEASFDKKTA